MTYHKRLTAYLLIVVPFFTTFHWATSLPTCDSDRPGGESHRTLYVNENKLSRGQDEDLDNNDNVKWANALCCVYTHVEISSDRSDTMELYDGSTIKVEASTFVEMAELAMEKICKMSMGKVDCREQQSCIDSAMAGTNSPTNSPTNSGMNGMPSMEPSESPLCRDSSYRFKIEKDEKFIWRDCKWVSNRATKSRCKLAGVKSMCPNSCGTCNNCVDSTSRMKFYKADVNRVVARDCKWTSNKDIINRCNLDGMINACRKTCGQCL